MIGNYTSIYLNRLVMKGDYTIIYLIRLIMVGGSTGCGLLLSVVNYCYLLWFVCSIIAFYIPSARFFPFLFSLFTKIRKSNSNSSFFILHSSFFILHSSFFILHFLHFSNENVLLPIMCPSAKMLTIYVPGSYTWLPL